MLASALGGAALAVGPALERRLPEPVPITLAGLVPPRGAELAGWLTRRAALEDQRELWVRDPTGVRPWPRERLGLRLDTAAALAELGRPRPPSSVLSRLRLALGARAPEPLDLPPRFTLDTARASAWLTERAAELERAPVDARLDLPRHERVEARPGRELDRATTLARLAALGAGDELELAFRELAPTVPTSALADVDPALVLSQYETDFARRGGPRVRNIARAARYLDGTLLAPGQVWSFNRTVGPRTLERGFVDAPVIVADEVEPGVGGGVCQVATTLFAAGVLGGLDVVQRRSHSRPSGYAPLGLDATVIDGEVDLKLRNPYPVSIIVHAFLPVPTRVRVEMLGVARPGEIEHSFTVRKSEDFFRRVDRHPELSPDQIEQRQKGSPGYDVLSTVKTRYTDGSVRLRHYSSTYYPVPEVFWVGSAVDPKSLPPLPERASHTELGTEGPAVTPASFAR